MNEYALIGWSFLDVLIVAMVAALYSVGGRKNKWIRRLIAPLVLVSYCAAIANCAGRPLWWAAWASYPLYFGAYTLGYGEKSKLMKWINSKLIVRTITATAYIFACLGIVVAFSAWKFSVFVLCAWAVPITVFLTAYHPFDAAIEEYLVCAMTIFFVPFFLYVK